VKVRGVRSGTGKSPMTTFRRPAVIPLTLSHVSPQCSPVLGSTPTHEGILGSRCSGGGQLPATRSCLVTSEKAWFERGEEGLCATFVRDMGAAPGAVVGSGRREAVIPSRGRHLRRCSRDPWDLLAQTWTARAL
jgi:hypothetical protein